MERNETCIRNCICISTKWIEIRYSTSFRITRFAQQPLRSDLPPHRDTQGKVARSSDGFPVSTRLLPANSQRAEARATCPLLACSNPKKEPKKIGEKTRTSSLSDPLLADSLARQWRSKRGACIAWCVVVLLAQKVSQGSINFPIALGIRMHRHIATGPDLDSVAQNKGPGRS